MYDSFITKVKQNKYVYFLLKLLVLFLILVCFDYAFASVIHHFYNKQKSGPLYVSLYAMERSKEDILIFGSSRACHHYNPNVFEERLGLSCYNVGRDGHSILYHYAVLKATLKRYTPKIIIFDFKPEEFLKDQISYDQLSSLLPFYKNHPEIRSIVALKSKYEKFKLYSHSYPYNSILFYIILGNTDYNMKRRNEIKGYLPLTNIWDKPAKPDNEQHKYELDTVKIKMYEAFIKECIHSGSKLYIVCSPCYEQTKYTDISLELGQVIAKKYTVPFYDYSRDLFFINNTKLFADRAHLNDEGAKIFSNMLIDKLVENAKSKVSEKLLRLNQFR